MKLIALVTIEPGGVPPGAPFEIKDQAQAESLVARGAVEVQHGLPVGGLNDGVAGLGIGQAHVDGAGLALSYGTHAAGMHATAGEGWRGQQVGGECVAQGQEGGGAHAARSSRRTDRPVPSGWCSAMRHWVVAPR